MSKPTAKKKSAIRATVRPANGMQPPNAAPLTVPREHNAAYQWATTDSTGIKAPLRVGDLGYDPAQDDPCGRCGCSRKAHKPDKAYTGYRDYRNQGPNPPPMIPITARTCCDKCPYCICFCVAFVEPFKGQPWPECAYAPKVTNVTSTSVLLPAHSSSKKIEARRRKRV
jgi:hypothetical protein